MANPPWSSPFPSSAAAPMAAAAAAGERRVLHCDGCGASEFDGGDDGFYYCRHCGSQSQDVVDTGCADEDVVGDGSGRGALYSFFHHRSRPSAAAATPSAPKLSREDILRSLARSVASLKSGDEEEEERGGKGEGERPYAFEEEEGEEPRDFGAGPGLGADAEAAGAAIRARYVQGLQVMLQRQCEALVEQFGVGPLICGLAGTIWLRYVAASQVLDKGWARKVITESKAAAAATPSRDDKQDRRKPSRHIRAKYRSEPHDSYGRRVIYIFFRALRKTIPIYSSLAICFLVCHIAREAVLPTDIYQWAIEGKLPYLTAFVELDKYLGTPSSDCPLSTRFLFRPIRVVGPWQLEETAASISQAIGLRLPSVNFYAIARRYLHELSLPVEKILQHACRLYEWSLPAELWLSSNASRLPTRVCVMSILIVTLRILYNIHGQGTWEMGLSDIADSLSCGHQFEENVDESNSSSRQKLGVADQGSRACQSTTNSSTVKNLMDNKTSEFETKELLSILEAAYGKINVRHDYAKDLPSYLKYCKDVAFTGITTSYDEETLIERLWDIYSKKEDDNQQDDVKAEFSCLKGKRSSNEAPATEFFDLKRPHRNSSGRFTCSKSFAIERMKQEMEENGFHYLPPRAQKRTEGYLHYKRKKVDGRLIYVAHADYYILLRSFAKLAQVDVRIMHLGVLKLERRLGWIELRIDSSLNALPDLPGKINDELRPVSG
ncbi:TATA box-binding protein-associated factor RNA polymerase I subunit B isoform X2 [Ananas comosus]|uniref:TATA box-binding protein-associated factor RNA polymerase I subunit B isoform X2 n=1 Tax=Ananas comosus TaxID=4615 RepID=A0A6P5GYV9_ANACO|nr:TATA box-binding protein-associated factor RNA polymerase I subunit B isoform X2 [Ananas comosus]